MVEKEIICSLSLRRTRRVTLVSRSLFRVKRPVNVKSKPDTGP